MPPCDSALGIGLPSEEALMERRRTAGDGSLGVGRAEILALSTMRAATEGGSVSWGS
jgi:hypothetical protein